MEDIWTFQNAYRDSDFQKYEYKEHKEQSVNIKDSDGTTYTFIIQDQNDYIHYSQGYLCVKLQILKSDNSNLTENDNVTLVNTGNLFNRAQFWLSNEIVEDIENPNLAHHVLGLANFTKDYLNGEASNMMFYPDTSDSASKTGLTYIGPAEPPLDTVVNINNFLKNVITKPDYNDGFAKRFEITKNSNIFQVWIPLKQYFPLFKEYNKLFSQILTKFVFNRNTAANMLFTDNATANYKVSFKDITMWLPHVVLKNEAELTYLEEMQKDLELEWTTFRVISQTNRTGNTGSLIANTTLDRLEGAYVIPQYDNRSDDMLKNNMVFDNLDLMQTWVRLNNVKYPEEDYTVDFNMRNQEFQRYYLDFLSSGLNNITNDKGPLVDYLAYTKLYPILYFNTSAYSDYTTISSLKLEFYWKLRQNPVNSYRFYFILLEKRKAFINMAKQTAKVLGTIR